MGPALMSCDIFFGERFRGKISVDFSRIFVLNIRVLDDGGDCGGAAAGDPDLLDRLKKNVRQTKV
jgi:hypothetical protein